MLMKNWKRNERHLTSRLLDGLTFIRGLRKRPLLFFTLMIPILLAVGLTAVHSASKPPPRKQAPPSPSAEPPSLEDKARQRPADIIIAGKLFCSLKRNVAIPFRGVVTALKVYPGQQVKEGDILLRYRLPPDMAQQIRRRLDPPQIRELQMRIAELDKGIAALNVRLKEMRQLAQEQMASPQSVENIEMEHRLLAKQRASAQDRLQFETRIAKDDMAMLREQLGKDVKPDNVPEEASLLAPISGHVIGMHSELREGAELAPGTLAVVVGTLDPMLMRTQVHEIEAVQVGFGDEAEVSLESMPNRTFQGIVTRLSWSPVTPGVDQPSYYELEIKVPNPDLSLREGLKGYAKFLAIPGQQK